MTPFVDVYHADNRELLKTLASCSVDAVVTDPPYALVSIVKRFGGADAAPAQAGGATGVYARASSGFMGRKWDTGETAFAPEFWGQVLRVLKPGGHVISFSATRTYHRSASAIEDAGFEIRDMILDLVASDAHVQAFTDSLSAGQRALFLRMLDESQFGGMLAWVYGSGFPKSHDVAKGIDRALGYDRAKVRLDASTLKNPPNLVGGVKNGGDRPWRLAAAERGFHEKAGGDPVSRQAMAWDGWGTALKPAFEPCVLARKPLEGSVAANVLKYGTGALNIDGCRIGAREAQGRWPANVVHDGSDEVEAAFPLTNPSRIGKPRGAAAGEGWGMTQTGAEYADEGSAARFFYSAKADTHDRMGSDHPTVKPVELMAWLVRLVCPPGGVVLDPFGGSGTTALAAMKEGRSAILIEREADHAEDIRRKVAWARGEGALTRQEILRNDLAKDPGKASGDGLPLFGGGGEGAPAGGGGQLGVGQSLRGRQPTGNSEGPQQPQGSESAEGVG